MPALTAAVTLIAALCLLNLLLTLGVIRRLREQPATQPATRPAGTPSTEVAPFTATTVDGDTVTPDLLASYTTVVFLAPECATCREQVPALLAWGRTRDRTSVLVVVDGTVSDHTELVAQLLPVARVIVERRGTPVADAFGVTAYPASCLVNDRRIVAWAQEPGLLPAPV
jgi:hypothetical protein